MDTPEKRCSKCGKEKPLSDFAFDRNRADKLRANCRQCNSEIEQIRRQDPAVRERNRILNQTPARRAAQRKSQRRPEAIAKKQTLRQSPKYKETERKYNYSSKAIEGRKRYAESPNGKMVMATKTRRRRALKRGLPADFRASDWQTCLEYFYGCCAVCGRPLKDLFKTVRADADHWIPLTDPNCPGTVRCNIVPLCGGQNGCNNSKQDKDPEEWLMARYGKTKAKQILMRIQEYFEWVKHQR